MSFGGDTLLVTGGASFIGRHLVKVLMSAGADVRVADDLSSGTPGNLAAVGNEVDLYRGTLKHWSFVDEAAAEYQSAVPPRSRPRGS